MTNQRTLFSLLVRWEEARAQGRLLSPADLCPDRPELVEELGKCLAQLQRMNQLVEGPRNLSQAPASETWTLRAASPPVEVDSILSTLPPSDGIGPPPPFLADSPAGGPKDLFPQVPGYEVLGILGEGGMGVVYRARQVALKRTVALKMIREAGEAETEMVARLRTEAEALARLQHPNIVQVHEIGDHQGKPYFSQEFCEGGSLHQRLADHALPPGQAADLVEVLARAMQAAHQANVIHRDLKPANVLLGADGTPKISDFGLAKKLDEVGQTQLGTAMGTPSYMAPEQARGHVHEISPATDVYALGAILYECLTGRPPFKAASPLDTILQVLHDDPLPPSRLNHSCPRELEVICLKCLQKRRADRYASAGLLADELRRYREGKPLLARPAGAGERFVKWARRSPAQAAALAASLAFVLAVVVLLLLLVRAGYQEARMRGQQAELAKRELEERKRRDDVRSQFTELFTRAERVAAAAPPGDPEAWAAVERDVQSALDLLGAEPGLKDFPLRAPASRLLAQAREHRADARERARHRAWLTMLKEYHGDAVVFGSFSTGLDVRDNRARARQAVARGLALFGVRSDNDGPPDADPRFYSPRERRFITACCYELLLLDAEILAQPRVGEKRSSWHGRLRQALALLARADRLLPGTRTYCGLARKAALLDMLGETDRAKQARRACAMVTPSLAADHFLIGVEHYRRDEFRSAFEPLANALRLQPDHYGAEYLLAVCRLRAGLHQDAKVALTRCLEQRPGFTWPRLHRGYAQMQLGEHNEALADFEAVLRDPPDSSAMYVALVNRGLLAMHRRRWDDAVVDLKRAIELKPDAMPAYINLALVYRQRVELPDWQAPTLLLAPGGVSSFLAWQAHQRRSCRKAVAVLDEAVGRQPRYASLYRERGRLYRQLGDLVKAREDLARAVACADSASRASTLPEDLMELGRLLHEAKEHAKAVEAFKAVLMVRPDLYPAHRLVAEALLAQKRYPEAGAALDRYLGALPAVPGRDLPQDQKHLIAGAFKMRGLVHVQRQDFRGAVDCYTHALKIVRDPDTLALRGWAYLMVPAAGLALADFDETLRQQPGLDNALLGRADALVKLGKVPEALKTCEDGLARSKASSRAAYLAARIYAQFDFCPFFGW